METQDNFLTASLYLQWFLMAQPPDNRQVRLKLHGMLLRTTVLGFTTWFLSAEATCIFLTVFPEQSPGEQRRSHPHSTIPASLVTAELQYSLKSLPEV